MNDVNSMQPSPVHFHGHTIQFVQFQRLPNTEFIAAVASIDPPTSSIGPDLALGLGIRKEAAQRNALVRAKDRIRTSEA